jgi:hypothetical protein
VGALALLVGTMGWAPTASAYVLDANDARTVAPGGLELEFQPAGWYQTFGPEGERYLIAPSVMVYAGLADGWDLIVIGRGYVGLEGGDQTRYSVTDNGVFTRLLVREGSYAGDDAGPSIAIQLGVILPSWRDEEGAGASAALLISQEWTQLDLHLNVQVDRRRSGRPGVFATIALEGPLEWPVHGIVEAYVDVEDGSRELSVLGALSIAPKDRWTIGGGVRYFDVDGTRGIEVRLSLYAAITDP